MNDYSQISYRQDGPVAVITIERPEKMNCIGPTTADELTDAWQRFKDSDDALVAVMTGAGDDAFSAGGDIDEWFDRETRSMVGFRMWQNIMLERGRGSSVRRVGRTSTSRRSLR